MRSSFDAKANSICKARIFLKIKFYLMDDCLRIRQNFYKDCNHHIEIIEGVHLVSSNSNQSHKQASDRVKELNKNEFRQTTTILQGSADSLIEDRQKAKVQEPCLIVIQGKFQGHRFLITKSETILGRDGSADIVLGDPNISRKHAWLIREAGEVKLRDLDSANGIFVNDRKIESKETLILKKEDHIRLGNTILKFVPAGEIETVFYEKLMNVVNLDALTQVYKRAYLLDSLENEFKRAKSLQTEFSLIFFIIDQFKLVNDQYGHDAGDFVLKQFASLARRSGCTQPNYTLARYGGEEFVLLLPGVSPHQAEVLAQQIQGDVQSHAFVYEGSRVLVTSSFGISSIRLGIESALTLLKKASKTLDRYRETERSRIVVSSD